MKKTLSVIGVLFAAVFALWVYNSVNEITTKVSQPQPAVTNPEPTVSAPATSSSIIVVTGNVTPVYK